MYGLHGVIIIKNVETYCLCWATVEVHTSQNPLPPT